MLTEDKIEDLHNAYGIPHPEEEHQSYAIPRIFKREHDIDRILNHITESKDEILQAIGETKKKRGRVKASEMKRRGPKDTRLMKIQRTALVIYVTVELHKPIVDVTLTDSYHVWNLPEHREVWGQCAGRKDTRRGYKDHTALYGVVRSLAEKSKLNISQIIAV